MCLEAQTSVCVSWTKASEGNNLMLQCVISVILSSSDLFLTSLFAVPLLPYLPPSHSSSSPFLFSQSYLFFAFFAVVYSNNTCGMRYLIPSSLTLCPSPPPHLYRAVVKTRISLYCLSVQLDRTEGVVRTANTFAHTADFYSVALTNTHIVFASLRDGSAFWIFGMSC